MKRNPDEMQEEGESTPSWEEEREYYTLNAARVGVGRGSNEVERERQLKNGWKVDGDSNFYARLKTLGLEHQRQCARVILVIEEITLQSII